MLFLQRIPKLLRWIFSVVLILLLVMSISRFIIFWKFNPPGKAFSGSAFIMGFRYDARVVCIIGLAIMLLCAIPFLNPFKNYTAKKFWNILLPLIFIIMVFVMGSATTTSRWSSPGRSSAPSSSCRSTITRRWRKPPTCSKAPPTRAVCWQPPNNWPTARADAASSPSTHEPDLFRSGLGF